MYTYCKIFCRKSTKSESSKFVEQRPTDKQTIPFVVAAFVPPPVGGGGGRLDNLLKCWDQTVYPVSSSIPGEPRECGGQTGR
jgi:hypothetical protein